MIQLKRILYPTTALQQGDEALPYAVALARAYDAKLLLCHCIEPVPMTAEVGWMTARQDVRTAAQLRGLLPACDVPAVQVLMEDGDPAVEIPRLAAEHNADLIVMRSRRRPRAAALLGSTAEAVCRTAPCPVLVTHEAEREWVNPHDNTIALRRILVAHDFSNDAELAFNYGLMLAQEYQAELHLLHVLPFASVPGMTTIPESQASAMHQAARRLQSAVPAETYLWCEVKHAIRCGQPYREILTYAEEQQIDLICLGVSGAGFAMRALFGSNADRVLRQAPCPVLITRPLKPLFKTGETS
ncbi:MAG: universal stress protein [Acidobacteria bacterium]|nr:universal stress protein [Acidobacteriota bacterium]